MCYRNQIIPGMGKVQQSSADGEDSGRKCQSSRLFLGVSFLWQAGLRTNSLHFDLLTGKFISFELSFVNGETQGGSLLRRPAPHHLLDST